MPWPGRGYRRKCHPSTPAGASKPSSTSAIASNGNSSILRGRSVRLGQAFSHQVSEDTLSKFGFRGDERARTAPTDKLGEVSGLGCSHSPASTRPSTAAETRRDGEAVVGLSAPPS